MKTNTFPVATFFGQALMHPASKPVLNASEAGLFSSFRAMLDSRKGLYPETLTASPKPHFGICDITGAQTECYTITQTIEN